MKIAMIGTGYVGLVTGTCFAENGNDVVCVDIDAGKVERLCRGDIPIYEPGLIELVNRNVKAKRLRFTTDYSEAIPNARCVFVCVGTPQDNEGRADLKYVQAAAHSLAPHLSEGTVVVVKSTVPPGTNREVAQWVAEKTATSALFASNPEFLKEGAAIDDFTKPDRVVVGIDQPAAAEALAELYKPFLRTEHPFLTMSIESAEMTKYVANCMLATKISFINEMANLCELVGADVNDIRRGIGHDRRIGFAFLFPGVGYGGSCFPKDVRALNSLAEDHGMETRILKTVDAVNSAQKEIPFRKLNSYYDGNLSGRTIAIWGLSFKPKTDDVREAPSLVLIDQLLAAQAVVRVHDPEATENVRSIYGEQISYCQHHYDTLEGADALVIVTEWNEYRNPDFGYLRHKMNRPVIFDGRNLFNPQKLGEAGIEYFGVGLLPVKLNVG